MANPFDFVILRLNQLGFFQLLLFMLTSAVFYGLLRKSKLFGEPDKNIIVNGVVALVAAFMVWSAPTLLGIDIVTATTTFFVQGISATIVIMVALMITGMFAPEGLGKRLEENLKGKFLVAVLVIGLIIGIGIFFASGISNLFFPASTFSTSGLDTDTITIIVIGVLMVVSVLVIVGIGGGGGKS
jgi:hypothetical protein